MKIFLLFALFAAARAGLLNQQRAIDIPIERFAQVEQNNNLLPGQAPRQFSGQRLVSQPSFLPTYAQANQQRLPERPYTPERSAPIPQFQSQPQSPQQPQQHPPQQAARRSSGGFPSAILAQVLNSKTPEQIPNIPKDSGVDFLHARPLFEFSVSSTKPIAPKKYRPQQQHQQLQQQQQQQHSAVQQGPVQGGAGAREFNQRHNVYLTPGQPQLQHLPESRPLVYSAATDPVLNQRQQQHQQLQQQQQQQQHTLQQQQGSFQRPTQPHALPPLTTVTYI